PGAARGSVPITRPIRVQCYTDRMVLLPDAAQGAPRVVPMTGSTTSATDDLVSALWARMDQWGIAGRGMYWQPILRVQVMPGGERRFAELSALLDQSGIIVEPGQTGRR
ncbi:MAG: hypothetical protein ACOY3P_04070, partial [Planctomycetota bacterium]